jgi:hypothetical protein
VLASQDQHRDFDLAGGRDDVLGDPVQWPGEPGLVACGEAVSQYLLAGAFAARARA